MHIIKTFLNIQNKTHYNDTYYYHGIQIIHYHIISLLKYQIKYTHLNTSVRLILNTSMYIKR